MFSCGFHGIFIQHFCYAMQCLCYAVQQLLLPQAQTISKLSLEYLNIESFENRKITADLVFYYKICNNLTDIDDNGFCLIPITVPEDIDYKSESRRALA